MVTPGAAFRALFLRASRTRGRRAASDHPEGPLYISDLYGDIQHLAGPIVHRLIDTDQRAGARLLDATLYASPLLRGLASLIEHFDTIAGMSDLDPDIAGLFRQASDATYEGIKTCIYAPGPRIMDQSRLLMEVEFLLRDLTARPHSVGEWRDADGFRRNQRFGFGQLRSRRERDLNVEPGRVLPDRDEYRVHSMLVHPRPARELSVPDETPDARRRDLLFDLADLFDHAMRVLRAAGPAIQEFSDSADVDAPPEGTDEHGGASDDKNTDEALACAQEFIDRWQASWRRPVPSRPASVPVNPKSEND